MRGVILTRFDAGSPLRVEDLPDPILKPGQVLVKMAAAPINPSDLVFLRNQYGVKKTLPVVPGFEGSGTVVAADAGLYGRWLIGKRVACRAPHDGHGTWAEFMATEASGVAPLLKEVTLEQGASLLVNPLTAWALLTIAREGGHHVFIQNAAASALGRMIERLARRWGLMAIHLVRRREQVELLKKEGAIHVLDTSQSDWNQELKKLCEGVSLGFDAIGGDLTAQMADALRPGGRILVYGLLSGENPQMKAHALIFEDKHLEGFWLVPWMQQRSWIEKFRILYGAQKLLASELHTDVQARFPLEKINEAIALYKEKRTDGKVLLTCHR
jgi:NADPH:quinone reductase